MKYQNLDLEVSNYQRTDGVERFRVRVSRSPVGEQRPDDADEAQLPSDLRGRLRRLNKRGLSFDELVTLGTDLASALLPPRARQKFYESLAYVQPINARLRVRLKLYDYMLADLPWEYAYVSPPGTPTGGNSLMGFLGLNLNLSLVRYEEVGRPAQLPAPPRPLRMVTLLSNADPMRLLNLDGERNNIELALQDLEGIKVDFYANATVNSLQEALLEEAQIFHFAGHGNFTDDMGPAPGQREGNGSLLFMGESNGDAVNLRADTLALNIADRGVRLAVLNACESSQRDDVNAWTGIAPVLMYAGVPAVVGMQFTIKDENAVAFSRFFYRSLVAGQSIDVSVISGRRAIVNRNYANPAERDWGVPVLYLRAEDDGILFPKSADETAHSLADTVIASEGLAAFSKLMNSPEVRAAAEVFRDYFQDARTYINILSDYKGVHDQLHDLQRYYDPIVQEVRRLPDVTARENLRYSEVRLGIIIDNLKVIEQRGSSAAGDIAEIIEELAGVLAEFQLGNPVDPTTGVMLELSQEHINSAMRHLTQTVALHPTQINERLTDAAANLHLPDLVNALMVVRGKIPYAAVEAAAVSEFETGVDALMSLHHGLSDLIKEHGKWQIVDNDLRRIESRLAKYQEELTESWIGLRKRVNNLCQASQDKWATLLMSDSSKLDNALKAQNLTEIKQYFRSYRARAGERFYQVDNNLNELCSKIRDVGVSLDAILRRM